MPFDSTGRHIEKVSVAFRLYLFGELDLLYGIYSEMSVRKNEEKGILVFYCCFVILWEFNSGTIVLNAFTRVIIDRLNYLE